MVTTIERRSLAPAQPEEDFSKEPNPNGHHKDKGEERYNGDSFNLYLNEVAQFPLLSKEGR